MAMLRFNREEKQSAKPADTRHPWKILVIDDEPDVHRITGIILQDAEFLNRPVSLLSAYSAAEARTILQDHPDISVAIVDVVMESETAGLELVNWVRNTLKNKTIRLIIRTGQPGTVPEAQVVRDYDINDFRIKSELTAQGLSTSVHTEIRTFNQIDTKNRNADQIQYRESIRKELLFLVGEAIEARKPDYDSHTKRVALLCEYLARKAGLDDQIIEEIGFAIPLHDIGKLSVPREILTAPRSLNGDERQTIESHARAGMEFFEASGLPHMDIYRNIAGSHHENWDGSGYPLGLSEGDIPVEGRIVAICDVIDSLACKTFHRETWPQEQILKYIVAESGKKFDPDLVRICVENFDEVMNIRKSCAACTDSIDDIDESPRR